MTLFLITSVCDEGVYENDLGAVTLLRHKN